MKKIIFLSTIILQTASIFAGCISLSKIQLSEIVERQGYTVDSDNNQSVFRLNDEKCLYQIKAHKSNTSYILTFSPMLNTLTKSHIGFYYQYFDKGFLEIK